MSVLAHAVTGDGPPLLLLNGGLMTYPAWEPLAAPLAPSFRLIRCDFRGQSLSPGDPPATLDGHAADLAALLDSVGETSVHVAGASYGALVGLVMAARMPERVRSLVAMTATERITRDMAEGGTALREACRVAADGGDGRRVFDLIVEATWSPAFRQAQAATLAARREQIGLLPLTWFSGLERLMAPLDELDLRPLLPAIACPTLIIGGEADLTFPVEHSRALAAGIRGARLEIVAGGSHGLCIEHAPEIAGIIRDFVREIDRAGAVT
jgi:3-oxoadipate enol-lactonase